MAPRSELHTKLKSILGSDNVYFQPPPTLLMKYPCIRYNRDRISAEFADNNPYFHETRYQVTAISRDPDSDISMKLAKLPKCTHDRFYTADGLNHDVFNLFF